MLPPEPLAVFIFGVPDTCTIMSDDRSFQVSIPAVLAYSRTFCPDYIEGASKQWSMYVGETKTNAH
jgi:hypothetical protein